MSDTPNAEEFYKKLKVQLEDTTKWPSEYLYKFIVKSEPQKIAEIETKSKQQQNIAKHTTNTMKTHKKVLTTTQKNDENTT